MNRFMSQNGEANGEPNRSSTPCTMASATGPTRVEPNDLEASLGVAARFQYVPREMKDAEQNKDEEDDEENDEFIAC